ncbi:MAG: XdhC family protein, partial [Gammaproteobacteria bacterium]|nr:XdhC family protein [Gammaproteobacteria bacterium]
QPRLIRVSPSKEAELEPGIIDFGMTCHSGGTLDIFIEPVLAKPALLIIGGAPSAQVLSVLANRVGFAVTSACPGATAELFPEATQFFDSLDLTSIATPPFVVVATQGKRDEEGLEAALASGASTIAFIASERKAEKLRSYLKQRGHDANRVDAIISPAGIDIGAVTPEEIALSVLAALVKLRREMGIGLDAASATAEPAQTSTDLQAAQSPVAATQTTAIDPVCGMSVDITTAEYKSDFQGQSYYFCCAGCQHSFDQSPQQYLTASEVGK